MKKSKLSIFLYISTWFLLILIFTYLYYILCNVNVGGDYAAHNRYAKMVYEEGLRIMYPGYHLLVGALYKLTSIPTSYTAVFVLVIAICASILITQKILKDLFPNLSSFMNLLAAISGNVIQPIFTYGIRPGYNSGNGYISPTQALCKPFALLAVWLFCRNYMRARRGEMNGRFQTQQLLLTVVLILSCFVKPMFAMAFIPAMGILLLIDFIKDVNSTKAEMVAKEVYKDKGSHNNAPFFMALQMVWPLFVTGLFLIGQYIYGTTLVMPEGIKAGVDSSTHVRFGFLHAWSMVTDHVWLSILMAYVFPLAMLIVVTLLRNKNADYLTDATEEAHNKFNQNFVTENEKATLFKKIYGRICLLYGIVSFLYISCLYQDNGFEMDMNFRNGWIMTFVIVQIFAIGILAGLLQTAWKKRKQEKGLWGYLVIPSLLFLVQMAFGAALLLDKMMLL